MLHGLTHLFPSAEILAGGAVDDCGLPAATVKKVAALAAGVACGQIALDHSVSRASLLTSLAGLAGIESETARQIASRLGFREGQRSAAAGSASGWLAGSGDG